MSCTEFKSSNVSFVMLGFLLKKIVTFIQIYSRMHQTNIQSQYINVSVNVWRIRNYVAHNMEYVLLYSWMNKKYIYIRLQSGVWNMVHTYHLMLNLWIHALYWIIQYAIRNENNVYCIGCGPIYQKPSHSLFKWFKIHFRWFDTILHICVLTNIWSLSICLHVIVLYITE